jgi:hydrogenase maturation protease
VHSAPSSRSPDGAALGGSPPRTAVVALGSVVMGDDGAGAAALAALESGWELPETVDCLDLGTPGPYFAEHVRGYDALVVVDALRTPGEPGTVRTYGESELSLASTGPRLTPHVLDLGEALATLDLEGLRPAIVRVVGVVPERVRAGTELSPRVAAAIPDAAAAIARELAALGLVPERRARPLAPATWWT